MGVSQVSLAVHWHSCKLAHLPHHGLWRTFRHLWAMDTHWWTTTLQIGGGIMIWWRIWPSIASQWQGSTRPPPPPPIGSQLSSLVALPTWCGDMWPSGMTTHRDRNRQVCTTTTKTVTIQRAIILVFVLFSAFFLIYPSSTNLVLDNLNITTGSNVAILSPRSPRTSTSCLFVLSLFWERLISWPALLSIISEFGLRLTNSIITATSQATVSCVGELNLVHGLVENVTFNNCYFDGWRGGCARILLGFLPLSHTLFSSFIHTQLFGLIGTRILVCTLTLTVLVPTYNQQMPLGETFWLPTQSRATPAVLALVRRDAKLVALPASHRLLSSLLYP